jgi:hypothetical protein
VVNRRVTSHEPIARIAITSQLNTIVAFSLTHRPRLDCQKTHSSVEI